jgi:hypothetical protein
MRYKSSYNNMLALSNGTMRLFQQARSLSLL